MYVRRTVKDFFDELLYRESDSFRQVRLMQRRFPHLNAAARTLASLAVVSFGVLALVAACDNSTGLSLNDPALIARGKDIFRFDTFGDETFWTDTLRMHEVI